MQKITPFLWFDTEAEEAARFYTSLFKNSSITHVTKGPEGRVEWISFTLAGEEFMALNGGPVFTFTEAISLFVSCETQEEVDELWGKLSAEPKAERCGWLKDRYGLSWQIIPTALSRLLASKDKAAAGRVMQAMLQMKKIDIAKLQEAHDHA